MPRAPVPADVIISEILSHFLGQATGINLDPAAFDPLVEAIRNQGRHEEREAHRSERPRAAPPPPPPPPPPPRVEDPRVVLGLPPPPFKLTEALIRERRRKLTELFHPDASARGSGNPVGMQRINDAANALLAELRR